MMDPFLYLGCYLGRFIGRIREVYFHRSKTKKSEDDDGDKDETLDKKSTHTLTPSLKHNDHDETKRKRSGNEKRHKKPGGKIVEEGQAPTRCNG